MFIIFIIVGAVCAFAFPAFLVEAIREEDAETEKTAKKMAGITFGILVLVIMTFMLLLNL